MVSRSEAFPNGLGKGKIVVGSIEQAEMPELAIDVAADEKAAKGNAERGNEPAV